MPAGQTHLIIVLSLVQSSKRIEYPTCGWWLFRGRVSAQGASPWLIPVEQVRRLGGGWDGRSDGRACHRRLGGSWVAVGTVGRSASPWLYPVEQARAPRASPQPARHVRARGVRGKTTLPSP
jgi:hypothetical protein